MKTGLHIFLLLCCVPAWSQLVTSGGSPQSLVENVLLGKGVTVSNVQFHGSSSAIGQFDGTNTNLGIGKGIVMTTGTIYGNDGPQGPNTSDRAGINNGTGGFKPLADIVGATTYNASYLEFNFIPYSDTVRFKYVFGSEEYPEFVGSDFNDVFAFFISGPGISGLKNIALLPNGGGPVAINNVNNGKDNSGPCRNCGYYVYNGTGQGESPYSDNPHYIQYDGFTRVLEAVSKVECGKTYHLIIAIADVGDGVYDSGIFLQANSLTSKVPVDVDCTLSYDAFGDDSTMAEGCVKATVTLTREGNISQPLTIPFTVAGTATEGLDYTSFPHSVTFPAGKSTVKFTFDALNDTFNSEGIETINLVFSIPDACGGTIFKPINVNIEDVKPVTVTIENSDIICPGQPITLIADASGGVGPYVYVWSTNETTPTIQVSPASTQTYTVTITDNCLKQSATASGVVNVPVYLPLTVTTTPDVVIICPYEPTDLTATPAGGAGNYSYSWTNLGQAIGNQPTVNVSPPVSTSFHVFVQDQCGDTTSATINYTITSPPLVITMAPDPLICPGGDAVISVSATGGYGQYYYSWPQTKDSLPSIHVHPESTMTYKVLVSDDCQTFTVEDTITVFVIEPIADFIISSHTLFYGLPITFQNLTTGGTTYMWTFGDGQQSTEVHPNNTYADPGNYTVTLIAYNQIGCSDTVSHPIVIAPEYWLYVPNTFTPDDDRFNRYFEASTINIDQFSILIFNRWGEVVFSSDDPDFKWDGYNNKVICEDGTYNYTIRYTTTSNITDEVHGHVNLLR